MRTHVLQNYCIVDLHANISSPSNCEKLIIKQIILFNYHHEICFVLTPPGEGEKKGTKFSFHNNSG